MIKLAKIVSYCGGSPECQSQSLDGPYTTIVGPLFAIELDGIISSRSTVDKERANHHACATLARFAMDGHDISIRGVKPIGYVFAKWVNQLEWWWRMIVKRELSH